MDPAPAPLDPGRPLRLGFSPCPNDCFVFDALVHGRIDTPLRFDVVLEDVEALNGMARAAELDVAKVSWHAVGHLTDDWWMLRAGGALGHGVGPLLVARNAGVDLSGARVAVPGGTTTAKLLLRLFAPEGVDEVVLRYDRIMPAVAAGEVDAGLIIHESRFTYADHGLVALADLGTWWEARTGGLLPLGGIAVRKALGRDVAREVGRAVAASVAAAFDDPTASEPYVAAHAQELSPDVRRAHIELYVNRWSRDVGADGEAAVRRLLAEAHAIGLVPPVPVDLFVPDPGSADAAKRATT
ncbi:MAG: 1,4-dihydroxy-6-naphthoate synthase [Trueperaceae bacterium]